MSVTERSRARQGHGWTRWIGLALIVAGLGITLTGAASLVIDNWQQQQLNQQWQHEREAVRPQVPSTVPNAGAPPSKTAPARTTTVPNGAVFALQIPKLGYYAAVRQGVSLGILGLGPGHYPTTAWPGQAGNVGVAAHNTFWINFGDLRPGDEIVVQTLDRNYRYVITGTQIVAPSDTAVLAQDAGHKLTLTTCWPLWAGALATKRFIISAVQAP